MAQTQLTWYGQSGFKIVTPGGKVLLVDPRLTNPVFEKGKDELAALKDVDLILLSRQELKKRGTKTKLRVMNVGETITV